MIDVHVTVILDTQTFRGKKKTTTKPSLFFDLILMSRLTWITEKELEREINDKEDKISLETQHEQFQQWCENENC